MQSLELCHAGLKGLLLRVAGALPSKLEGGKGWGEAGGRFQVSRLCPVQVLNFPLISHMSKMTDATYLDS